MNTQDQELGPVTQAQVISSVRITPPNREEVKRIDLRIDDPAFRFTEGQAIGVVVHGPHPFGNKYHMRRYSIANARTETTDGSVEFQLLVRRCFAVDEFSGERHPGIASNYLCDAKPGETVTVAGPYRSPFKIPQDPKANLVMIATGTGIAPFRAFVQRIYRTGVAWQGQVRLYYGSLTGMDLLYGNDEKDDLENYYDETTFKAFKSLISKPLATDVDALRSPLEANAEEIWAMMQDPNTYVYLAGLGDIAEEFEGIIGNIADSRDPFHGLKRDMKSQNRWFELIYD